MRRVFRHTSREFLDFARAQQALFVARLRLRDSPAGWLVTRDAAPEVSITSDHCPPRAASLARAVDRASRFAPFRASCLVRAIALQRLLRAEGLAGGRIRVGVRRDQAGAVEAHAWVTYGPVVLDDAEDVETEYSVLRELRVDCA